MGKQFFVALGIVGLLVSVASGGRLRPVDANCTFAAIGISEEFHDTFQDDFFDANGLPGVVNHRAIGMGLEAWNTPSFTMVLDSKDPNAVRPDVARVVLGEKVKDFRKAHLIKVGVKRQGSAVTVTFPTTTWMVKIKGRPVRVWMRGHYSRDGDWRETEWTLKTALGGECSFGDRSLPVRLVDTDANLRCTDRSEKTKRYSWGFAIGDQIQIDAQKTGFEKGVIFGRLGNPIRVGKKWYTVKVASDGNSISAEPFEGRMAKVVWNKRMTVKGELVGDKGVFRIDPNDPRRESPNSLVVPAGKYYLQDAEVLVSRKADNGKPRRPVVLVYDDHEYQHPFAVTAGKPFGLKIGPPITVSIETAKLIDGGPTGRAYRIIQGLTDQSGREIRYVTVQGKYLSGAPFEIRDAKGTVVYRDTLEYG